MAGIVATTNTGRDLNPLLTAKQRTWHDMDLLNGLAGWAPEHRTWLSPDNGAEHKLFTACLRGVKELGKFGILGPIAGSPSKVADILSDHKDIQGVMVDFLWKKSVAASPRVFFGILPTDPMAPVMKEMVTEARLLKAFKATNPSAGTKVPKVPRFEVHCDKVLPKAQIAATPAPQALASPGVANKA